jgi:cytochrome c biogenesis protein CcmG/thiol:disulfide interchange protein DsbE
VAPAASGSPAIRVTDAALLPATVDALPETDVESYDQLLGQLRGTPVVVNFWASWCEPCTQEMPMLTDAAHAHADSIQFVGVDVLDNRGSATDFIARFSVPFPSLFDPNGDVRNSVGAIGQPVTVFYAADGSVVAKVEGQISEDALAANLASLSG